MAAVRGLRGRCEGTGADKGTSGLTSTWDGEAIMYYYWREGTERPLQSRKGVGQVGVYDERW